MSTLLATGLIVITRWSKVPPGSAGPGQGSPRAPRRVPAGAQMTVAGDDLLHRRKAVQKVLLRHAKLHVLMDVRPGRRKAVRGGAYSFRGGAGLMFILTDEEPACKCRTRLLIKE